ncbi:hypothetical protein J2Y86_000135 [Pseudomonas migulae]|uniref:hypothetical protein n=1 Tax=Pseudomonas migulae TaxID=78543 RepID=UPI0020A16270|nr:hypothetical protein [Pseudomonas migulae]MCP1495428.1 hypothetical protein [Pseudomonas migulae]
MNEFSCKIRTGGPRDADADLDLPIWAGVLPIKLAPLSPVPEGACRVEPAYVTEWR